MTNLNRTFPALFALLLASPTWAGVTNPTTSQVLPDRGSPLVFHVLPPSRGKLERQSFLPDDGIEEKCELLRLMRDASTKLAARASSLAMRAVDDASLRELSQRAIRDAEALFPALDTLARMHGGMLRQVFDTGLDENLRALRTANPGKSFVADGGEPRIRVELPQLGDPYLAARPQVLSYEFSEAEPFRVQSRFEVSAQLSVPGACAILRESLQDRPFATALTYRYSTRTSIPLVIFDYDPRRINDLIEEQAGEDGLFAPKDWGVVLGKMGAPELRVRWSESDRQGMLSGSDRLELEREIRAATLGKILSAAGVRETPSWEEAADPACGPQGAYCAPAVYRLLGRAASALRGKTVTEAWDDTQPRMRAGVVVFDGAGAVSPAAPQPARPLYQGSPRFRAEIADISGPGLEPCDRVLSSVRESGRIEGRLTQLLAKLDAAWELPGSEARAQRLLDEAAALSTRLREVAPTAHLMPTAQVKFVATIPTLWPRSFEPSVGRLNDTIRVDEALLPGRETDEDGPLHRVPRSLSGGNNHFTGPDAALDFEFSRRLSLRELCEAPPRLTLSVTRTLHPDADAGAVRREETALIEARYERLKTELNKKWRNEK
jgi:hypothetical protein